MSQAFGRPKNFDYGLATPLRICFFESLAMHAMHKFAMFASVYLSSRYIVSHLGETRDERNNFQFSHIISLDFYNFNILSDSCDGLKFFSIF